jgi:quinol monooxygenase YgiN
MKTSITSFHVNSRLLTACIILLLTSSVFAQEDKRVVRIAKIKIDSAQLENYKSEIKEQIEAAVRSEPGVLMLFAVHDKNNPTNVTVFEIYADTLAYQSHLQTPHFKKYKANTSRMVKSLELTDVTPIQLSAKKSK